MATIKAFQRLTAGAVRHFWKSRDAAARKQKKKGATDKGGRAGVTGGKNLDGFSKMVQQIITDNGIIDGDVYASGRKMVSVPGFYRPIKSWDLLVVSQGRLVAAVEFKSHVGPSFGNNFNNRVEEALGNALDLKTAFREGVFGDSPKPFIGYFFMLEECEKSMSPVKFSSPHFKAMPEFKETSYAKRYEILCRKLVQEELYDAAALILTKKTAKRTGKYRSLSNPTSGRRFASALAGRIAGIALE